MTIGTPGRAARGTLKTPENQRVRKNFLQQQRRQEARQLKIQKARLAQTLEELLERRPIVEDDSNLQLRLQVLEYEIALIKEKKEHLQLIIMVNNSEMEVLKNQLEVVTQMAANREKADQAQAQATETTRAETEKTRAIEKQESEKGRVETEKARAKETQDKTERRKGEDLMVQGIFSKMNAAADCPFSPGATKTTGVDATTRSKFNHYDPNERKAQYKPMPANDGKENRMDARTNIASSKKASKLSALRGSTAPKSNDADKAAGGAPNPKANSFQPGMTVHYVKTVQPLAPFLCKILSGDETSGFTVEDALGNKKSGVAATDLYGGDIYKIGDQLDYSQPHSSSSQLCRCKIVSVGFNVIRNKPFYTIEVNNERIENVAHAHLDDF